MTKQILSPLCVFSFFLSNSLPFIMTSNNEVKAKGADTDIDINKNKDGDNDYSDDKVLGGVNEGSSEKSKKLKFTNDIIDHIKRKNIFSKIIDAVNSGNGFDDIFNTKEDIKDSTVSTSECQCNNNNCVAYQCDKIMEEIIEKIIIAQERSNVNIFKDWNWGSINDNLKDNVSNQIICNLMLRLLAYMHNKLNKNKQEIVPASPPTSLLPTPPSQLLPPQQRRLPQPNKYKWYILPEKDRYDVINCLNEIIASMMKENGEENNNNYFDLEHIFTKVVQAESDIYTILVGIFCNEKTNPHEKTNPQNGSDTLPRATLEKDRQKLIKYKIVPFVYKTRKKTFLSILINYAKVERMSWHNKEYYYPGRDTPKNLFELIWIMCAVYNSWHDMITTNNPCTIKDEDIAKIEDKMSSEKNNIYSNYIDAMANYRVPIPPTIELKGYK